MALQAEEDKKRMERQNFLMTTVSICQQASYEPSEYKFSKNCQNFKKSITFSTFFARFTPCRGRR